MRVSALGVAVGLLLAGVGAGVSAPAVAAPPPEDRPAWAAGAYYEDDDDSRTNDWDVVRIAIPMLQTKLRAAFPGRYADGWLDSSRSPSVLQVRLHGITPADSQTLAALAGVHRSRFELVPSTWSGADFDLYKSKIDAELALWPNSAFANVDPVGNVVLIDIDEEPVGLRHRIEQRGVPAEAFDFRTGLALDVQTHLSRQSYPPHEGALHVVVGTVTGGWTGCTSAWSVQSQIDATQYFGLTAGHCGDVGDDVYIGTTRLSAISRSVLPSNGSTTNTDSARYYVARGSAAPRILREPGSHRDVTAPKWNYSDLYTGQSMCVIGQASAGNGVGSCGPIRYKGSRPFNGGTLNKAFCFEPTVTTIKGDSGAPVFTIAPGKAYPAGIAYGQAGDHPTWTCATMVAAAGAAMDTQLIYA